MKVLITIIKLILIVTNTNHTNTNEDTCDPAASASGWKVDRPLDVSEADT